MRHFGSLGEPPNCCFAGSWGSLGAHWWWLNTDPESSGSACFRSLCIICFPSLEDAFPSRLPVPLSFPVFQQQAESKAFLLLLFHVLPGTSMLWQAMDSSWIYKAGHTRTRPRPTKTRQRPLQDFVPARPQHKAGHCQLRVASGSSWPGAAEQSMLARGVQQIIMIPNHVT